MTENDHEIHDGGRRRVRSNIALALAVALAVAIFCVSAVPGSGLPPNLGIWSTVAHFCEFAVLGALLCIALEVRISRRVLLFVIAVAIASAYGASDEFHQLFVPGRFTDVRDWITDTCGAAAGAAIALAVLSRMRPRQVK